MVDIAKCLGIDCTARDECHRYTVVGHPTRQVYQTCHKDAKDDDGRCSWFWCNKIYIAYEKRMNNGK